MTDVGSSSKDPSFPSGYSSSLTVTQKPKCQERFKKKHVQLKSSLGLVANIAKFIIMGIFSLFVQKSGINWFLRLFGLALKPLNMNNKREKRKHSEVDNEECDDKKISKELEEMKIKRWRPDHAYEAINEFVKKMWGERDTNENVKEEDPSAAENDENMNNYESVHDGKWNKKPDINFVPKRALVGIQTVGEGDSSIIRDLTPKKIDFKGSHNEGISTREKKKVACEANETVDELDNDDAPRSLGTTRNLLDLVEETAVQTSTPLIESKTPEVFVFSADKTTGSKTAEDIPEDEQSMLSLMTFGEKQVYFAQQIQAQEAAAPVETTICKYKRVNANHNSFYNLNFISFTFNDQMNVGSSILLSGVQYLMRGEVPLLGGVGSNPTAATTPVETTICKYKRVNANHNSFCNSIISNIYNIIINNSNNLGTGAALKAAQRSPLPSPRPSIA